MYPEFGERLKTLVALSHGDLAVIEPCGFLWVAVGMLEEGISLLERVVESVEHSGDAGRAREMREVVDAIRNGWDVLSARAFSFAEAHARLAEPAAEEKPPHPAGDPRRTESPPEKPRAASGEAGYQEEDSIVRSALGRLQAKVQEEIGDTDLEARYNLGIAYKEMGLIDEAIAEFQLAAKDENRVLECASMLGICFIDKGMPKLAVKWFEKGLQAPGRKDEEYMALRYDLASAHEAAGEAQEALSLYSDLYGQDTSFRDVATKVRELRAALG
jgi:tetratricopeptide (TPR) repeat protein